MDKLLISMAVALQPTSVREELRREWMAELAVAQQDGDASGFALRLVRSAPSTAMQLRAETKLAFAELSIALLFGTFSSFTFAASAVLVDKADMGLWHALTACGTFLLAVGLWRDEGGFFGGRLSRGGAVLLAIGRGALSTYPIHIPTQEQLVARDDIALMFVTVGIVVAAISHTGAIRSARGVRIGLFIAAVASAVGGISDVINFILLDEPWQVDVSLIIAAITSLGAAIALFLVLPRDQVFEMDDATVSL